MDPNREINQAAQGDPLAIEAYNEFHGSIEAAISSIAGRGILFDLHGQVIKSKILIIISIRQD